MTQSPYIWEPSAEFVADAHLTSFARRCGFDGQPDRVYQDLHSFSVTKPTEFWRTLWDFLDIPGTRGDRIIEPREPWYATRFFPDARLNVATVLLSPGDPDDVAIVSVDETGARSTLSRAELRDQVRRVAAWLAGMGVVPGDRVAAVSANRAEAVVAMLGAGAIGATFTSVSPDFGVDAVLDRFGQVEPVVLFGVTGYDYGGKRFETASKLVDIVAQMPTLKAVVQIDQRVGQPTSPGHRRAAQDNGTQGPDTDSVRWSTWSEMLEEEPVGGDFEEFPFDHPWYILYSSGTTGAPKCIVHKAGGVLLTHLKEHRLAVNIGPGDVVFYFTTLGWMMWNWLVSALGSGATIVCYDGSPAFPDVHSFFRVAKQNAVTVLGTSAKFLDSVVAAIPDRQPEVEARDPLLADVSQVRTLCSTGSPLSPDTALVVHERLVPNALLAPISGGTDLCGCFVGSVPTLKATAGVMQGAMLGMDMDVVDEDGSSVQGTPGELVCRSPFPSIPIGFWDDSDGVRFADAYFNRFPGMWYHGDFATRTSDDGYVIHGRSDATLNPGGVRIGTAEIYRYAESVPGVKETIAVGQAFDGDTRIVLFVVPEPGVELTDDLKRTIATAVRTGASPRHVPAVMYAVSDVPRTRSGKISEIAVRDVLAGRQVKNTDALANPESLEQFAAFKET